MGSVEYFSDGAGAMWLAAGMLAVLAVIGITVRFSRMRPLLGNLLLPSGLVVLCLAFWFLTLGFPQEAAGPAVIPRLYIAAILVLSGVILARIFRGKEKSVPGIEQKRLLILAMALLIAYFLAMPFLGYFLSTFVFIVLMLYLFAYSRKGLIWVIAGGWVVFSYFLFYKLLYIQLPLGVFEGLFR